MGAAERNQWAVDAAQHAADALRLVQGSMPAGDTKTVPLLRSLQQAVFLAVMSVGTVPPARGNDVAVPVIEYGLTVTEALDRAGC
jgi:hypothetical protein